MKSAIIFDFAAYRKPEDMIAETISETPSCSDELGIAIQLLIQALRESNPFKQTG